MLWEVDKAVGRYAGKAAEEQLSTHLPSSRPTDRPPYRLTDYTDERRRKTEFELLGFSTDCHPMTLHRESLQRFRLVSARDLSRHVGRAVLCAGMLTTAKPVHTAKDEPMQFATFDDGDGLIETVLFPEVYRTRGHVLFDPGPFIFRGKVEEEFGGLTVTMTHLERLERLLARMPKPRSRLLGHSPEHQSHGILPQQLTPTPIADTP
jgi:DNA polymerase III alpha subunit